MMSYSIQSISVGYLIDEEEPMIWRGPMVTKAMQQLLGNTRWKDLDYLIIDMPPGTGDIQLTLSQQVPVAGAVIVTTPQDIATLDARKGLQMFRKVNVPVLGIVENMSLYTCSNCGHQEHIFGSGGGERIANDYGVPMLGSLPLNLSIRENADNGRPTVVADPDGEIAGMYRDIAVRMAAKLSMQATDFTHKMPKIVIKP
jgi:ATP-binding protein involved in chromosome partitioning